MGYRKVSDSFSRICSRNLTVSLFAWNDNHHQPGVKNKHEYHHVFQLSLMRICMPCKVGERKAKFVSATKVLRDEGTRIF